MRISHPPIHDISDSSILKTLGPLRTRPVHPSASPKLAEVQGISHDPGERGRGHDQL